MKTTIFVVDDELMAIRFLKSLILECGDEYEVVGEATNGARALKEIQRLMPDIVLADITMPIMNGLDLAMEVRNSKNPPVVFLVTAYKDFEFVKKGIQAGVKDYILKNELSETFLKDLLDRTREEINAEKRNRHIILEKNIRDFLNSDSDTDGEMIHKSKSLHRYALIHIVETKKIALADKIAVKTTSVDCYDMSSVDSPDGIICNAFVEMGNGEYVALISIQPECKDDRDAIGRLADIYLEKFKDFSKSAIALVSDITCQFIMIHSIYRESRASLDCLYLYKPGVVIWEKDLKLSLSKVQLSDVSISKIVNSMEEDSCEECINTFIDYARAAKQGRTVTEYSLSMKNVYRYLIDYANKKRLNIETISVKEYYDSTDELEGDLIRIISFEYSLMDMYKEHKYSPYVLAAMEYIQKNYMYDISIPDIAEAVNISEGHLRRCFKQELNTRVVNYLMDCRLEHAKRLITNTSMTFDEIWKQTGFTSAQYFSYAFKQNEGISPREYSKRLQNG